MKKVRLNDLENNKIDKLKQYKLDKESIEEFRSKIKQVSEEESEKLALDLYELIRSDNFNDDYLKATELIYNGANVNYYSEFYELFDICIKNNYIKTIIVLLRAGLDIGAFNHAQKIPIMVCAEVGNKEILELLVLMDTNINYENSRGETALSLALENNNKECVDILINAQARFSSEYLNKYNLSTLKDKKVSPINDKSTSDLIKEAKELLNSNDNYYYEKIDKNKFDLLTEEQIFGNDKLDILSIYGTRCTVTDFAILLGSPGFKNYNTSVFNLEKSRIGQCWSKTKINGLILTIDSNGEKCYRSANSRDLGIRPVVSFSLIRDLSSNEIRNTNGIKEFEFGEYPQMYAGIGASISLERNFKEGLISETGKTYTTDSVNYRDSKLNFIARTFPEYIFEGDKYIRFVADSNCDGNFISTGLTIEKDKIYWVKVEPITWLIDEKSDIALSKRILVSGIKFNNINIPFYDGVFEHSFMYKYLNEIFAKDIVPSKVNNKQLIKK